MRRQHLALTFALLLAACGGGETPAPGGSGRPIASVGISVASLRNPYYAAIARGAEAEIRAQSPTAQITTAGDDYSALKQATQIDGFVAAHLDMILFTPADPEQIADALARAHAAGIAVVAIDAPVPGADAEVATDNIAAGALACGALAARVGQGAVAILGGPASPVATARSLGCADALSRAPDILAVPVDTDGSREGARRAMRDLLATATRIDAVFAINDVEALGAADAAAELGRATPVASAEGSPVIEAALASRARENIFASAALDPYAMGRNAVRVGADLRRGRAPKSADRLLDPTLVTRETVHDYKGWAAERE